MQRMINQPIATYRDEPQRTVPPKTTHIQGPNASSLIALIVALAIHARRHLEGKTTGACTGMDRYRYKCKSRPPIARPPTMGQRAQPRPLTTCKPLCAPAVVVPPRLCPPGERNIRTEAGVKTSGLWIPENFLGKFIPPPDLEAHRTALRTATLEDMLRWRRLR